MATPSPGAPEFQNRAPSARHQRKCFPERRLAAIPTPAPTLKNHPKTPRKSPPPSSRKTPRQRSQLQMSQALTQKTRPVFLDLSPPFSAFLKISRSFSTSLDPSRPLPPHPSSLPAHCLLLTSSLREMHFRSRSNRAPTNRRNSKHNNHFHQKHPKKEPQKTPKNLKKPRRTSKNPHRTSKNLGRTSRNLAEPQKTQEARAEPPGRAGRDRGRPPSTKNAANPSVRGVNREVEAKRLELSTSSMPWKRSTKTELRPRSGFPGPCGVGVDWR